MEDKESPFDDFPQLGKILDGIKAELKNELKAGLDEIKNELKAEFGGIHIKEFHSPMPNPPPPPPVDFPEIEIPDFDIFSGEDSKKTEEFTISDFTDIEVGGTFDVEIVQSDSYSVSITAEEGLFRNLDVSKEGDTLRVGHSKHIGWRFQFTRPKARITLPALKELSLSGAARGVISGFTSSENLKLELSGATSVTGEITVGDAEFELSGASRARLMGSAKDVVIKTSGASRMDLSEFSVNNAAVKMGGDSRITVKMDGRLDARLNGVSHFSWIGNPVMGNIRTSGMSRLSKVE